MTNSNGGTIGYWNWQSSQEDNTPDLTPIDPHDDERTASWTLLPNSWGVVKDYAAKNGRYGIEILTLTDEEFEALRTGKRVLAYGDLEYTTVIVYKPRKEDDHAETP